MRATTPSARRFYTALMSVRDPDLARQALAVVLSPEIPPQAAGTRLELLRTVGDANPSLAWQFFTAHSDALFSHSSAFERVLAIAQYIPPAYWNAAPLDQIEGWVRGHTPPAACAYVARGMERARSELAEKGKLAPATDAYLAGPRPPAAAAGAGPGAK